ncbi:hypothetical protein BFW87_23580 [Pseudomonas fluorescens]|uniref:Uncharacterized protein n=1 Tax=Pseudomonas fluorescens TaxID=294 RepID=A0A1T2Y675_PSEFL|nr:hypothetical protein [Pseudomonas fluorescens]OPA87628.1 hypothetical protein BFW87_23580 [Pseudomonas fluorescens]
METPHFYKGGWKTTAKHKKSQITAVPLASPKIFKIGTISDSSTNAKPSKFRIIADGQVLYFPVAEEGYILVEAKDISIEQVNDGTFFVGSWEVIQEPQLSQVSVQWVVPAQEGEMATLASFKTETEAVFSFNYSKDPASPETDCLVKLFVDGKVLKNSDGGDLTLVQGSSIYIRGKVLGVHVAQGLPPDRDFGGELKIVAKSG